MYTNSPDNRYGSLAAEIYDIDKPFGKLPDTAFYRDALKDLDGPILEPACGSGRTLVPLAEVGHEMWGFDTSAHGQYQPVGVPIFPTVTLILPTVTRSASTSRCPSYRRLHSYRPLQSYRP